MAKFHQVVCPSCTLVFRITMLFKETIIDRFQTFYCPLGHTMIKINEAQRRRDARRAKAESKRLAESKPEEPLGLLGWLNKLLPH